MSFAFSEQALAIRDRIRNEKASFPGGEFPGDRPIELDDAWVTKIVAGDVAAKTPAIYVKTSNWSGQRQSGRCYLGGENLILATWVDTIERYEKSAETISEVMSWLAGLAFTEDLDMPTFTAPDGTTQVLECYPVLAHNYEELQHLGIVGAQVGYRFDLAHHFTV